jgi:hypothetical protein
MDRPETELLPSSSPVPARRPEDFPLEVHGSLATLRAIAKQAKSRTDPGLRWATEDEITVAVTLQKPWMCTATSAGCRVRSDGDHAETPGDRDADQMAPVPERLEHVRHLFPPID